MASAGEPPVEDQGAKLPPLKLRRFLCLKQ